MKVLICGLPGSGKTTLAEALARELQCVHFNADEVRKEINKDLGFSIEDRIEQARRMGVLCDIASRWGSVVLADFVCPTPETRTAFSADFTIWVDRIKEGRFEDTNKMFVPPEHYDVRITGKFDSCFPSHHADDLAARIKKMIKYKHTMQGV